MKDLGEGKYTKFKQILIGIFILNLLLVATHEGEFWPFSIFPMFSKAGNPWTRAMVQQVKADPNSDKVWETMPLSEVSDNAVSLEEFGIDQIDYANFVSKTEQWTEPRIRALRKMFDLDRTKQTHWMVTRIDGYLTDQDSVVIEATPLILFTQDSSYKNPNLF